MEFTVSGTTVRFDERTMQFAFTRDGAEWNACADFKPTLQCAQGTFAFADAASITHEQRETGTGTGIRSILKPMYGWSVPQAMCSSNGFRSMSKA